MPYMALYSHAWALESLIQNCASVGAFLVRLGRSKESNEEPYEGQDDQVEIEEGLGVPPI